LFIRISHIDVPDPERLALRETRGREEEKDKRRKGQKVDKAVGILKDLVSLTGTVAEA
jgi:hypothetical protein